MATYSFPDIVADDLLQTEMWEEFEGYFDANITLTDDPAFTLKGTFALPTGTTVNHIEASGSGPTVDDNTLWTSAQIDAHISLEDLDFQGDSGTGSVDLDSEVLDIAGGTNINTSASSQTLTVNLDTNIVMADGAYIGRASSGPQVLFDDSNDYLEITGCKVGIGIVAPLAALHVARGAGNRVALFEYTAADGYIALADNTTTSTVSTRIGFIGDRLSIYTNNNLGFNQGDAGHIAVGTAVLDYTQALIGGTFTSGGASTAMYGVNLNTVLTGANGDTSQQAGMNLTADITTQSNSETIDSIAQLRVIEPNITKGTDTITVASTVDIVNAPTEGASNYALLVRAGAVSFGGTLTVAGMITANGGVTLGAGDDLIGSATSDININSGAFSTAGATGNTVVGGTLDVTGNIDPTTYETTNGGFKDEDNMASNSATATASQQSIVAYITAQSALQDLDGTTDSGNFAVLLDSQTFTVAGGTNLNTAGAGQTATINLDDSIDLAGTLDVTGLTTLDSNLIIPDAGYIGSVSDTDAIQIEADGDIVMSQDLAVTGTFIVNSLFKIAANGTTVIGSDAYAHQNTGLIVTSDNLIGPSQHGIQSQVTFASGATTRMQGITTALFSAAASYTTTDLMQIRIQEFTKGAGHTVTNQYGLYIDDQNDGTNNWAIKTESGLVEFGDTVTTSAGRIVKTTRIDSGDSPYTALASDHAIFADTDGGAITINLPAGVDGTEYKIKNCGTSGNDVTVDGDGGETVDFDLTQTVSDGEAIQTIFESTEEWQIF